MAFSFLKVLEKLLTINMSLLESITNGSVGWCITSKLIGCQFKLPAGTLGDLVTQTVKRSMWPTVQTGESFLLPMGQSWSCHIQMTITLCYWHCIWYLLTKVSLSKSRIWFHSKDFPCISNLIFEILVV